jgi:hypothetical protein
MGSEARIAGCTVDGRMPFAEAMMPVAALFSPAAGRDFCADCEMDHIDPDRAGTSYSSPDGASRFQCPGRARPSRRHTPPAALFSDRPDLPGPGPPDLNPRRLVICVLQDSLLNTHSSKPKEIPP